MMCKPVFSMPDLLLPVSFEFVAQLETVLLPSSSINVHYDSPARSSACLQNVYGCHVCKNEESFMVSIHITTVTMNPARFRDKVSHLSLDYWRFSYSQ